MAVVTNSSAPKVKRHFQIATVAEGPVIILWETECKSSSWVVPAFPHLSPDPDPERPVLAEDHTSTLLGTWITAMIVTVVTLFLAIAIPVTVSVRHENGDYPGS